MSDIPLNLEDGAFWLPSDVLEEITITNTNSEKMTSPISNFDINTSDHIARENVKVCELPNGNGSNVAFQLTQPFTPFPAVPQNLGFGNMILPELPKGPAWPFLVNREIGPGFTVKSEGTGVFLPRSSAGTSSSLKKNKKSEACEETGGTGVYLNQQAMIASHKKKKGRKNDQAWKKQEKVECESNELRLPEEWTY